MDKNLRIYQEKIESLELKNTALQNTLTRKSIITKSEIETERDNIKSR